MATTIRPWRPREAPAIIRPEWNDGRTVFVFGSNLAGRHGAGAALSARQGWGAVYGVGVGRTGMAYAVPTKDAHLRVLAVEVIAGHVRTFQAYAAAHPELTFLVSRIGCGLASEGRGEEREREISTLFRGSPENVALPPGWPR